MRAMKYILLLVLSIQSSSLVAGSQGGSFSVSSLRVGDDGVYIKFDPAPSACGGGEQYRMHARIRHGVSNNYNALVSTLLSAYTSKKKLNYIWFSDLPAGVTSCSNTGGEILEITMIELAVDN